MNSRWNWERKLFCLLTPALMGDTCTCRSRLDAGQADTPSAHATIATHQPSLKNAWKAHFQASVRLTCQPMASADPSGYPPKPDTVPRTGCPDMD